MVIVRNKFNILQDISESISPINKNEKFVTGISKQQPSEFKPRAKRRVTLVSIEIRGELENYPNSKKKKPTIANGQILMKA